MRKTYSGAVKSKSDVSFDVGRIHAMCDIMCDYIENTTMPDDGDQQHIVTNNIVYGLQIIHDLVYSLEAELDNTPVLKE